MRKPYQVPRIATFGTIANLTHYGAGAGSNDTVYLANPAGANAVLFLQVNGFPNEADAEAVAALLVTQSQIVPSFNDALSNVQGDGGSFNPTVALTFTP